MRRLQKRMIGGDVAIWQRFLSWQGIDPGRLDADFGNRLESATKIFQTRQGIIPASGIVDEATVARALPLGFDEPEDYSDRPDWPLLPDFSYINFTASESRRGETRICETEFGDIEYLLAPTPDNPEHIRITNDFEGENITTVNIPQLRGIFSRTRVRWNNRVQSQLVSLWQAWDNEGLLPLVRSWAGSYVPRLKRGGTTLSNHALGTAFDINVAWNGLGHPPARIYSRGSVRELVEMAHEFGFYWGGHFNHRPDGMHFEVVRLM